MTMDYLGTAMLCALAALMQATGGYSYDAMAVIVTAASLWWLHLVQPIRNLRKLQRRINQL
jgi:hypothetical protein